MKRIFGILAVGILLQFAICIGNSFSYTVEWDELNYYAGVKVGGNPWVDEFTPGIEAYDVDSEADDFAAAIANYPHHLETVAYATSEGPGESNAHSLFFGKVTVSDGAPGTAIPSYVTGNLTGWLEGEAEEDGYFRSGVGGAILLYDATNRPDLLTLVDSVKAGTDLPTDGLLWSWHGDGFDFTFSSEDESETGYQDIIFTHSGLFSFASGQPYYVLAGFGVDAYASPGQDGSAYAYGDFYDYSFDFDITQAAIPEPASLSLLGLGLVGLLGLKRKK